jgi:hypothetical protein
MSEGSALADLAGERAGDPVDLGGVTLLLPFDHPDPAQVLVSGTGLTHLGSAEGRDKMHAKASEAASSGETLTDSMRMFKNPQFRRPGSVHVHFFGISTLSLSDNVETRDGDVFEIEAQPFRLPLRNPLRCGIDEGRVAVQAL